MVKTIQRMCLINVDKRILIQQTFSGLCTFCNHHHVYITTDTYIDFMFLFMRMKFHIVLVLNVQ